MNKTIGRLMLFSLRNKIPCFTPPLRLKCIHVNTNMYAFFRFFILPTQTTNVILNHALYAFQY